MAEPGVAAIVLAAGMSSRYRAADPSVATKLVASLGGKPLVRHVAEAALASAAHPVIVVAGFAEGEVRDALKGLDLDVVLNPSFADGLSTSLIAGIAALPDDATGTLVLLGDMPSVSALLLDRLIGAFTPETDAVIPVYAGRRGNPALLGRSLFAAALRLTGDEGARRLLARARVLEMPTVDAAVFTDIDDAATLRSVEASRNF